MRKNPGRRPGFFYLKAIWRAHKKQTSFDERYGGLEHPELYYGWKQRGKELTALEERYGKMLERMNRSYMDMEVEPTFTFSGTAADVTPYQQQIDQMRGELEDYVAASNGLPDPSHVRQQQTNIARLQAALDTLPAEAKINAGNMQGALSRTGTNPISLTQSELPQIPEEERSMLERSLNQIVLGNFTDDVTLLGTVGQFLLGLTGVDVLLDARDLAYDLTHLREVPAWQVLADAVGLIPVIGALKNTDEVAALIKAFRQGENLLGNLGDGARAGSRLALAGAGAAENVGTLNRVSESFEAAADAARAGQRLTETGEVVADTAKATERTVDSTDEVVDSSKGLGYNGGNRFSDIDLKPTDLMEELANSGVKYTEEDVLMVTRNSNSDLLWLENGSKTSGLTHILERHEIDFYNKGFSAEEVPGLLQTLVSGKYVDVQLNDRGYHAVYEYADDYFNVIYGTNGYIVSFFPGGRK